MAERLFVGIRPSDAITQQVTDIAQALPLQTPLRWTPTQHYHITASFFGETDSTIVAELNKRLHVIAATTIPFSLHTDHLTTAPPRPPRRMLWATFKHSEPFDRLVRTIEEQVGRIHPLPNARKSHAPIPHITVGRTPKGIPISDVQLPRLPALEQQVNELVLFRSQLSPHGPTYTVKEVFPLG